MSYHIHLCCGTPFPRYPRLPKFEAKEWNYQPPPIPMVQIVVRVTAAEAAVLQEGKPRWAELLGESVQTWIIGCWVNAGEDGRRSSDNIRPRSSSWKDWRAVMVESNIRGKRLVPIMLVLPGDEWSHVKELAVAWGVEEEAFIRTAISQRVRKLLDFYAAYPAEDPRRKEAVSA